MSGLEIRPKFVALMICSRNIDIVHRLKRENYMARIILKKSTDQLEVSHKKVGQAVLGLAAVQHQIRLTQIDQDISRRQVLQTGFTTLVEKFEKQYFDIDAMKTAFCIENGQGTGDATKIEINYIADGEHSERCYTINIVLPDIGDKWVDFEALFGELGIEKNADNDALMAALRSPDKAELKGLGRRYDFSAFAEESLGFIVIFGCGR